MGTSIRKKLREALAERDLARAENLSIRIRATHAHEAVYRAMSLPPDEALASLQDEGFVHRAIHDIFDGPDGTAVYPLDQSILDHITALEKRALMAEQRASSSSSPSSS